MRPLTFEDHALGAAYPYHLVFDYTLALYGVGSAIEQELGAIGGKRIDDVFELIVDDTHGWTLRAFENRDFVLRGRLVHATNGAILFTGQPFQANARKLTVKPPLEAVGQLASGVAHEINTPIQYIGDSVQFLFEAYEQLRGIDPAFLEAIDHLRRVGELETAARLARVREDADADHLMARLPKAFQRTFDGIEHVTGVVRAMKAFARTNGASLAPADLNEALTHTLAVARHQYTTVADVETELAELPLVPCRIGELNQVFLNLIVNAAHAISERNAVTGERGHLRVRTRAHGTNVEVEIADDGAGIPESVRERIFEPFFTTKPVGQGTGQGLPISLSIVQRHGGTIDVSSETGAGTTFKVVLPLVQTRGLH